jgi:hypothetical protein
MYVRLLNRRYICQVVKFRRKEYRFRGIHEAGPRMALPIAPLQKLYNVYLCLLRVLSIALSASVTP